MTARSVRSLFTTAITLQLVLTTLLTFWCLYVLSNVQTIHESNKARIEVTAALGELRSYLLSQDSALNAYLYTGRQALMRSNDRTELNRRLEELRGMVKADPANVERMNAMGPALADWLELTNRFLEFKQTNNDVLAKTGVEEGSAHRALEEGLRILNEMEQVEREEFALRRAQIARLQYHLMWQLLGGLLICLAVGGRSLQLLLRRLEPLSACAAFAASIGEGDLSPPALKVDSDDEIGQLTQVLNVMAANLRELTSSSRIVASRLSRATEQILTSAQQQAASVQQQVAAVGETSATVEELGHSAAQIASRARQLASAAGVTSQATETGLRAVTDNMRSTSATVDQVRTVASRILALSEKTQAIGDIVSTLNDLSERSNVLALNAAILAASSGDGRGFTVVASEMKSLADQSKEATVEVPVLLGDVERGIQACVFLAEEAVKRVEASLTYTDAVNSSIQKLADNVSESLNAFQQIVASTQQQQMAFEQVNQALASIRQASEQTAASTRQFESSARELHGLGGQVLQSIERYRME